MERRYWRIVSSHAQLKLVRAYSLSVERLADRVLDDS
jgi:hypothetical protein